MAPSRFGNRETVTSPVTLYRMCDLRYDPLSGAGASIVGGRWNPRGMEVVYAAEHFGCALLERLVQISASILPYRQRLCLITLPLGSEIATVEVEDILNEAETKWLGRSWLESVESLALRVPSAVAPPYEFNFLLNPRHPDFARLDSDPALPISWDERLPNI